MTQWDFDPKTLHITLVSLTSAEGSTRWTSWLARVFSWPRIGPGVSQFHQKAFPPGRWPLGSNGLQSVGGFLQMATRGGLAHHSQTISLSHPWCQCFTGRTSEGQCWLPLSSWPHPAWTNLYEQVSWAFLYTWWWHTIMLLWIWLGNDFGEQQFTPVLLVRIEHTSQRTGGVLCGYFVEYKV